MSDPLLRAFLLKCSDHAEALFKPDRPEHEFMLAHIIAEKINGDVSVFACPMIGDDEVMFRVALPRKLRAERKHRHWCFFAEAWAADVAGKLAVMMPRNNPARIEVVAFLAENMAGEQLGASRQIYHRPGQPRRLLPLVFATNRSEFVMEANR